MNCYRDKVFHDLACCIEDNAIRLGVEPDLARLVYGKIFVITYRLIATTVDFPVEDGVKDGIR